MIYFINIKHHIIDTIFTGNYNILTIKRNQIYIVVNVHEKHKIHQVKNKKLRIIGAVVCIVVLISFITGVVIGAIGGHEYDITLMKTGIWMSVISGIFMGMLHILYFRTPKKFRKKLFGE